MLFSHFSNGTFSFTAQLAFGTSYNVTVVTQPTGKTCTVTSSSSGTIPAGGVNGVVVSCDTNMTTLSVSVLIWH